MRKFHLLVAVGMSCLAVSTAYAQDAASPTTTGEQPDTTGVSDNVGDIIVTARRVDERLQDVPASVAVVSGETIQKLNLTQFEDVEVLSPGLDLDKGGRGFRVSASVRGVAYDSNSGAQPAVDVYVNDVPMDLNYAFNSIYDVGQIEVLRGPQGTLRGRPAPTGAITLTTKRPDLDEIGGYVNMLASDRNAINGQGALNIPIVPGVLAVRVAGVVDQSEGDGIRSINSGVKPRNHVESFRVTAVLKPVDNLDLSFTYQELRSNNVSFEQVFGTGYVNRGLLDPLPSNYNGPALTSRDRLSVAERPTTVDQFGRFMSWQARLQIPQINSELIYIGANQKQNTVASNVDDAGNSIINFARFQTLIIPQDVTSHELRLQSVGKRRVNYVVGFWSYAGDSISSFVQPIYFAGAFAPPGNSGPVVNNFSTLDVIGGVDSVDRHKAIFGNLSARFFERFEVSVGARYNDIKSLALETQSFVIPGFGPVGGSVTTNDRSAKPWTYQASAKYEFSDNLMAYASYGRSFRLGPVNVALETRDGSPGGNAVMNGLIRAQNETSDTYEIGLKGSALDGRFQFSVAAFEQRFPDMILQVDAPYLGNVGGSGRREVIKPGNDTLLTNAKTRIRGLEAEANFRITPNWTFGVAAAYAKGKILNDVIPCRDGDGDGIPDDTPIAVIQALSNQAADNPGDPAPAGALTPDNPIAFCNSSGTSSISPNWSATVQSEIRFPFGGDDEFYLRGLFSYKPENRNAIGTYVVPADANLNLYAGVRLDDRIEIGAFAKNVFNQNDETSRSDDEITGEAGLGSTGYFRTARTLPREVGLTVRASFGSR